MFVLGAVAAGSEWMMSLGAVFTILKLLFGLSLLFSCVLLVRKESWSSWMMLAGAAGVVLLFIPEGREVLAYLTGRGVENDQFVIHTIFVSYGCLCLLLVGFLLHALHHRAAMRRITELETILTDQQERLVSSQPKV